VRTLGVDWAAHGKPKAWWAAHGSLAKPNGLRMAAPYVGLWAVQSQGWRPKDERMVDGPLEDLVFQIHCNLLVFLGWAKIVAIYFMLKYYNICYCMITCHIE
jgi:hypothetical protein